MNVATYLDQDQVWISKDGGPMNIADMSPEWRRNAAKWLLRHAEMLRVECRIASLRDELHSLDDGTTDDFRREGTDDLVAILRGISKPDEWIKGTELYRTLVADLQMITVHVRPDFMDALKPGFRVGFDPFRPNVALSDEIPYEGDGFGHRYDR